MNDFEIFTAKRRRTFNGRDGILIYENAYPPWRGCQ